MKTFETALEARKIVDDLEIMSKRINYNPQISVYLNNLGKMVSNLSSAEVLVRQTKKQHLLDKPKKELAEAIDYFEKLLLIQMLAE